LRIRKNSWIRRRSHSTLLTNRVLVAITIMGVNYVIDGWLKE
jgi:hypothetical protein